MDTIQIIEQTEGTDEVLECVRCLCSQLTTRQVTLTRKDLDEMFHSGYNHLFFIYYGGNVAGMMSMAVYRTPTGRKVWLEDVVIENKFRGRGLGRKLMAFAIDYAQTLWGPATLMLTSRPSRVAANNLYRKSGFVEKDTHVFKLDLLASDAAEHD